MLNERLKILLLFIKWKQLYCVEKRSTSTEKSQTEYKTTIANEKN